MSAWNQNKLTEKLGIDYPIIQGPLGGLSSQRLTASVSNFGGLGSFGAHSLELAAIKDVIGEIRSLTSKPFAVNLWVSMEDDGARTSDKSTFEKSLAPLAAYFAELNEPLPAYKPYSPKRFEDQVQVLLDAKVPAFSFIFGIPPQEVLDECRNQGIAIIGTATTVDEAIALEEAGVDIVVASGFEAGGHRGSFLRSSEESLVGTFSLVPQVADAVKVPVVAAGGIADARGVVAALALGASGVQMGTVFLSCEESGASKIHRDVLLSAEAGTTALTRGFTGRLARRIRNRLLDELNEKNTEILPYPLQRMLIRQLAVSAEQTGRGELLPLWAGQSARLSHCEDVTLFLHDLVTQITEIAASLGRWSETRRIRS
ncbi:MAG TPA: nitronate monooxygenase [Pyrinomonadaceae bacterium]|nr:nitronate monooxygenase [Pyrinomonadaceae bacterium]